jgi:hypothetical protein
MYVVYDNPFGLVSKCKVIGLSRQLNIVAVYTRATAGPISEVVLFALCAIRVDHDVAWWRKISSFIPPFRS